MYQQTKKDNKTLKNSYIKEKKIQDKIGITIQPVKWVVKILLFTIAEI